MRVISWRKSGKKNLYSFRAAIQRVGQWVLYLPSIAHAQVRFRLQDRYTPSHKGWPSILEENFQGG